MIDEDYDDDYPSETDEKDVQKRELQRLLGTAHNKDRRNLIQNAISSLNSNNSVPIRAQSHIPTLHPLVHANAFSPQRLSDSSQQVSDRSSAARPMSAQRRRPSLSNLAAIPENRSLLPQRGHDVETWISVEDVKSVSTSCSDFLFNPALIVASSGRNVWMPTGLLPQCLTIELTEKWLVKRIEIFCISVECISVILDGTKESFPTVRESENNFVFSVGNSNSNHQSSEDINGVASRRIVIFISKATDIFFRVLDIKIKAFPYI